MMKKKHGRARKRNKEDIIATVEHATVSLLRKGGRGVLVRGNIVLTAAHCITYDTTGPMVLGDYFIEDIRTADGTKLKVSPIAVEPVADIAALGSVDEQELCDEAERFERFCNATKPVPLCVRDFGLFKDFPVLILNADKRWVKGRAMKAAYDAHNLSVKASRSIKGGASGGPIINTLGQLVGIISHSGGKKRRLVSGATPRPHLTLPVWVSEKIRGLGPKPPIISRRRLTRDIKNMRSANERLRHFR